ncbi:EF-hand calcium-binding domain-containing protein 11 isoform X2 [Chiloscyllium plagiosum]|uniref:EF-hand calcium-binding domain-containing protein 11 isoform X2 n=1 Tax=Chiloscyllium plagiosum TaxID=36176 RepID=UPI001CB853C2|nr:EF-hand calcium-binding domain-containing protein 11 isoform X2 [Chiloscyllium plagiosum]
MSPGHRHAIYFTENLKVKLQQSVHRLHPVAFVFRECDLGQKGYLSREDLKVAVVAAFGYKPSKLEIDMMMAGAVENNLPGLPLEQFTALMSRKLAAQDRYDEIRQIFSAFDARCCGFLTLDDFKRAFADVTPHLPEQTVTEAFSRMIRGQELTHLTVTSLGKLSEESH